MQTDTTAKAVKLRNRRADRSNCMMLTFARDRVHCELEISSRALAVSEGHLLADIDEDLPALDALQFENAMLHPWIVF